MSPFKLRMLLFALAAGAAIGFAALLPHPASAAENAESAWKVECAKPQTCRMETAIVSDDNRTVAMLAIRKASADGQRYGEMILPLGLHIPSGVAVQIDEGETFAAELIACSPGGCHAVFEATALVMAAMRNGYDFKARIVDARTLQPFGLKFSLIGFTATSKELAER